MNAQRRVDRLNSSRRILCAVDLTPRSKVALQRAMTLARHTGARVTLLHAINPRQATPEVRAQANRAYVQLLAMADAAFGPDSALIDVAVRAGEPLELIARAAAERGVELVVIAAPQRRPLDSIVGTTAERLIRKCKRPLLVVRQDAPSEYQQVALAVDLSRSSLQMIRSVLALGVLEHAHTTVLHASEPPYTGVMGAVGIEDEHIEQFRSGWRDELTARLHTLLQAAGLETDRTHVTVHANLPWPAIRTVVEQQRPQLLAIGASRWVMLKRLLLGSVADRVLREVSCDVLAIPHLYERGKIAPLRLLRGKRAAEPREHAPAA